MTADAERNPGDKSQAWVSRLFQMIDSFEATPATFAGEPFMELYARVERAIELSGESESQAFALDQALFNAISLNEVDNSDLRFVVCHALTIHHRYYADFGRGFEQAYKWCEGSRAKQLPDLRFIHAYLLPKLMEKGAIGAHLGVALFLMERIGRFENLEKSPVWDDDRAHDVGGEEPTEIVYQLARRRVKYIAENLTKVPNSLEQQLHKDGAFGKWHAEHLESLPILAHLLESYQYTRRESLWRRIVALGRSAFAGIVERMAGDYIAYELTKRKGAFIVQSVLMLVIVLGLWMALFGWSLKSNGRLQEIENDMDAARSMVAADRDAFVAGADSLDSILGRW